jgi:hypothetical protein
VTRRLTVGCARSRSRVTRRPSFFIALRVDHRRRPGRSMISKICRLSMRPCDQEDTWSETVIASSRFRSRPPAACPSEADGRLCRNARLPDMCERPRANAKAALGMARAPSFFTMSNSPPRDLSTQPVSFPAAHFLRPGCRVVVLCLHRISAALAGAAAGLAPKSLASAAAPTPK